DSQRAGQPTGLSAKWSRVLERTGEGGEACPAEAPACARWGDLKSNLSGETDPLALLAGVNTALNAQSYHSDNGLWGAGDYWATPAEFLGRGGDCEDYAIAKYFLLRELGVPAETMRIAVVEDVLQQLMHAV